MQIEAVKAAYRRYARIYDVVFGAVLQPGRNAVLQALKLKPGDRVLEVGVGTGLSLSLYPRDVRITGIERNDRVVRGRVIDHVIEDRQRLCARAATRHG